MFNYFFRPFLKKSNCKESKLISKCVNKLEADYRVNIGRSENIFGFLEIFIVLYVRAYLALPRLALCCCNRYTSNIVGIFEVVAYSYTLIIIS